MDPHPPRGLASLLGVRHPIVQGGMTWVSRHALAAVVSEAGGLGVLGSGGLDPAELEEELALLRAKTARPFGVNLPLINVRPDGDASIVEALAEVVLDAEVPVVVTGAGSPRRFTQAFKDRGSVVMHVVPSVALARKAEDSGVDAVVAESVEAGGHVRPGGLSSFTLIPQVVDALEIPVLAAGGIVDARGVAAAMALGASGVQLGTRFIATRECNAHPDSKEALIAAGEEDAPVHCKKHHAMRALRSPVVERLLEMEAEGASVEELATYRGRGRSRAAWLEGEIEEGLLPAGAGVGLVRRIDSVAAVIAELVTGFERVRGSLEGALDPRFHERRSSDAA